mgnify:FL=1
MFSKNQGGVLVLWSGTPLSTINVFYLFFPFRLVGVGGLNTGVCVGSNLSQLILDRLADVQTLDEILDSRLVDNVTLEIVARLW